MKGLLMCVLTQKVLRNNDFHELHTICNWITDTTICLQERWLPHRMVLSHNNTLC
jgi:hypothetical protein